MALLHSNNYRTTTTASINDVAITLPVTSVDNLPAIGSGDYCYLTLQNGSTIEIVKATAVSSLDITIERAQQNTTATTFASGSIISLRPTKESFDSKEPLLSGATLPTATVATDDKVIIQDTDDSNNRKTVTAQSIADLAYKSLTAFRVKRSTTQDVTSGVVTKIQLNSEIFDTGGYFDSTTNYRYTPLIAGKYIFNLYFNVGITAAGSANGYIYKNGVEDAKQFVYFPSATPVFGTVTSIINMNGSTDYIEFYIFINPGTVVNSVTYCSGQLLEVS